MDDFEQKISSLLRDPAALEQAMARLRSLTEAEPPAVSDEPESAPESAPEPAPEPAPDLSGLLGLLGSASGGGDPDTALLLALRPYLHGEREKRLDDALHLMRLKGLLPLLGSS